MLFGNLTMNHFNNKLMFTNIEYTFMVAIFLKSSNNLLHFWKSSVYETPKGHKLEVPRMKY